ncbi:MAG: ABC transporter permease subunit [Melioribacteraceae bacterium]|nr:ABC transporter permease subunit [Melioribacteraceae bacterium]MCF8352986.1 ABC transporter permease subunit [Melioribacteraceae bacterium]MCF8392877.1 ABC transporter permease subunit [Melioribacteraceae bacterium]MCF8417829.1 ABC transporter permease subunit [Melioribacteraceae bacterium]
MMRLVIISISIILIANACSSKNTNQIVIGSKKFTESVILGEVLTQYMNSKDFKAEHKSQLGGTRILWSALLKGEIDIYPDYTGTIIQEILSNKQINTWDELRSTLADFNVGISEPVGFNNTYAIGMNKQLASKLGISKISDLKNHPDLIIGFTNEFMDRSDGWSSLRSAYNLPHQNVSGIDHDLAYKGLAENSLDVIDLYSTDAEIDYYDLAVLEDDLNHFSEYRAVYLYRIDSELIESSIDCINGFHNEISEEEIRGLNKLVKIDKESEKSAASKYLLNKFGIRSSFEKETFSSRLIKNTYDHLLLVSVSLFAAILISIPLGIFSYRKERLGKIILGSVGVIQTIPSLALLVFMIPFFGIGEVPAIAALFLYSLLPIVRNTYLGFQDISIQVRESAMVLGLSKRAILKKVELPIASRSILSGIKTSAVINVGTATLGALIGAGGYGQPILTGIRLDNISLILEGAVPAAILALFVQGIFDLFEKIIVPKGLQIKAETS